MKVVLDSVRKGYIIYPVQFCETVEGFQRMREDHPEDTFIVADSMAQMMLDEFLVLLAFMGWKTEDWWISNCYDKENFMPIQDEKDEAELEWLSSCEPEYNWPNGNPYESETYRHYGVFPSWW